jgi:hypothetical protein
VTYTGLRKVPIRFSRRPGRGAGAAADPEAPDGVAAGVGVERAVASSPPPPQPTKKTAATATSSRVRLTRASMTGAARAPAGRGRHACPVTPWLSRWNDGPGRNLRYRRTRRRKRCSSSASGSLVRPVWTGDGWTIVLAGAVSQWNRSDASRPAIGPPAGSPAATPSSV